MKCKKCLERAVFNSLCKEHFIESFENKVRKTIRDYKLLCSKDRIIVGASGGKDSTAVLYLVSKLFKKVDALVIDEGIRGYRDLTINDLKRFCAEHMINLRIISFKDEFGHDLDSMMKMLRKKKKMHAQNPCTICGVLRRYLLNKYSKGYTKLVIGHNLDDEAQSFLMNLFRNNLEITSRLGPKIGIVKDERFVQRVKPLYFCTEKEVRAFALLKNWQINFAECPYNVDSFRSEIQDFLNDYESEHAGAKMNVVEYFMKLMTRLKKNFQTDEKPKSCETCGDPTKRKICKKCELISIIS